MESVPSFKQVLINNSDLLPIGYLGSDDVVLKAATVGMRENPLPQVLMRKSSPATMLACWLSDPTNQETLVDLIHKYEMINTDPK